MADEMVLIPRVRYERLLKEDNEKVDSTSTHSGELSKTDKAVSKTESEGEAKGEAKPDKRVTSKVEGEDVHIGKNPPPGLNERKDDISTEEGSSKKNKLSIASIVEVIPSMYKEKAEKVLAHINSKGVSLIGWNARGRLVYEGSAVNGSSIGELVQDLVSPNKRKKKSIGFSKFHKALVETKLPVSLLKPSGKVPTPSSHSTTLEKEKKLKKKWLSY